MLDEANQPMIASFGDVLLAQAGGPGPSSDGAGGLPALATPDALGLLILKLVLVSNAWVLHLAPSGCCCAQQRGTCPVSRAAMVRIASQDSCGTGGDGTKRLLLMVTAGLKEAVRLELTAHDFQAALASQVTLVASLKGPHSCRSDRGPASRRSQHPETCAATLCVRHLCRSCQVLDCVVPYAVLHVPLGDSRAPHGPAAQARRSGGTREALGARPVQSPQTCHTNHVPSRLWAARRRCRGWWARTWRARPAAPRAAATWLGSCR